MSKKFQASLLFAFTGLSLLSFSAKAMLEEEELNKKSYVVVRAWGPQVGAPIQVMPHKAKHAVAVAAGSPVGHASIQVVRRKHSSHYISFWPRETPSKKNTRVNRRLHTYAQDIKQEKGTEDFVVKLYSLNRKEIVSSFKENIRDGRPKYVLLPQADDEHNCCSVVLDLLKVGGLDSVLSNKDESWGSYLSRRITKPFLTTNIAKDDVTPSHIADFALAAQRAERSLFPKIEGWQ